MGVLFLIGSCESEYYIYIYWNRDQTVSFFRLFFNESCCDEKVRWTYTEPDVCAVRGLQKWLKITSRYDNTNRSIMFKYTLSETCICSNNWNAFSLHAYFGTILYPVQSMKLVFALSNLGTQYIYFSFNNMLNLCLYSYIIVFEKEEISHSRFES